MSLLTQRGAALHVEVLNSYLHSDPFKPRIYWLQLSSVPASPTVVHRSAWPFYWLENASNIERVRTENACSRAALTREAAQCLSREGLGCEITAAEYLASQLPPRPESRPDESRLRNGPSCIQYRHIRPPCVSIVKMRLEDEWYGIQP